MLKVLSLFDGISCGAQALNNLGIQHSYYSSEIDEAAIAISKLHHPDHIRLGDVAKLKSDQLPTIDLLIGGSPCQSFSKCGDHSGFEGTSGLFWEFVRLLKETAPTYFMLENVKMKNAWRDIISDALGVPAILIDSNRFSAQNRCRYYWTNIPLNPLPSQISPASIESIVGSGAKCYTEQRTEEAKRIRRESKYTHGRDWCPRQGKEVVLRSDGKVNCLTATESPKQHTVNINGVDRLMTVAEWEQLQGLPIGYTAAGGLSDCQRKKAIGNGWTIPVIEHLLSPLADQTFA